LKEYSFGASFQTEDDGNLFELSSKSYSILKFEKLNDEILLTIFDGASNKQFGIPYVPNKWMKIQVRKLNSQFELFVDRSFVSRYQAIVEAQGSYSN
jgi:hypothetical protein